MKLKLSLIVAIFFLFLINANGQEEGEEVPVPSDTEETIDIPETILDQVEVPPITEEDNDNTAEEQKVGEEDSIIDPEDIKEAEELQGLQVKFPRVGIYGHDFLRNNDFKYFSRGSVETVSDDYIIGVGDSLTVSVWNQDNLFSDRYKVSESGSIGNAKSTGGASGGENIGLVYLKGLTYAKAREVLKSRYKRIYRFTDNNFNVSLSGVRNIYVDIVGEVEKPGTYKLPATNSVFNTLKLSGGPTANGSVRNITVKRNGQIFRVLDLYKYLNDPSASESIYLQNRDVILITGIGPLVTIDGGVRKPGRFELKPDESFGDLMDFAGNLKANARNNSLQLYRYENNRYVIKDLDYDLNNRLTMNNIALRDGDLVKIDLVSPVAQNFVETEGALNLPGTYEYKNEYRVTDLVKRSSGLRFDAILDRAYITRLNEKLEEINIPVHLKEAMDSPGSDADIQIFPKDKLLVLSYSDFRETFSVEVFGDVNKPGKINFRDDLTLQDLLILSAGFKTSALTQEIEIRRVVAYDENEGRRIPIRSTVEKIEADFNFLSPGSDKNNFVLQPYDQVFVRTIAEYEQPLTIQIEGEVKYPGAYPLLSKDMRISDVLKNAGGLTAYAYPEGAKLFRKENALGPVLVDLNEIQRRESSQYNYVLKNGDRLIIPTISEVVTINGAIRTVLDNATKTNVAFKGRKSAKWYIDEFAGGYDKMALKRSTHVIEPNGRVNGTRKFLFFNTYPMVVPGSQIRVDYKPPKEEKSNEFLGKLSFKEVLALTTSLASTVLLIRAATK